MPKLIGFLDPAPDAPGFLIPLFRDIAGANMDLVQEFDDMENVYNFRSFVPPNALFRPYAEDARVEVGSAAIWAIKDHDDVVHVGASEILSDVAERLLGESGLFRWPLFRIELDAFRNSHGPDWELLQEAFRSVVTDDGELSAEVWRDTEIFAPAVRRDIHKHNSKLSDRIGKNLLVMRMDDHLDVFVEDAVAVLLGEIAWSNTKNALSAFSLNSDVRVKVLNGATFGGGLATVWRAFGIGGVARFVLAPSPFHGQDYRFSSVIDEHGVGAGGPLVLAPASQAIGICQSSPGQVELIARELCTYAPEAYVRHLVNIRPFSFNFPVQRKTPVEALPILARDIDHVWIIAGHRQRRTGGVVKNLTLSNAASRHVRSLLLSLQRRADLITEITAGGLPEIPSLNLFGGLRQRREWSVHEWVRNLLHTMLTEEALLHTAQRIVALIPMEVHVQSVVVHLGERRYLVDLIPDRRTNRSNDLLGWAIGVQVANRTAEEFIEFCIGLLEGYGWNFRGRDGDALVFEEQGEVLRVWPAHDALKLNNILEFPSLFGSFDLIITWLGVRNDWYARAADMEWSLIHYSDLQQWLSSNYDQQRFGGAR